MSPVAFLSLFSSLVSMRSALISLALFSLEYGGIPNDKRRRKRHAFYLFGILICKDILKVDAEKPQRVNSRDYRRIKEINGDFPKINRFYSR